MLDEREAVVVDVRPWDLHGIPHVDVTVVYPDRVTETARLGAESAPSDLRPREQVRVRSVMRTIVAIERPGVSPWDPVP